MEDEYLSFEVMETDKPYNVRHRCYCFSSEIVLFVKECNYERVFSSVFDQLVKSATSIGANVVEGKAGSSRKDWKNFYIIALKSASEAKYWLCLIRDTMDIDKARVANFIKKADEISNIIAKIIINADEIR